MDEGYGEEHSANNVTTIPGAFHNGYTGGDSDIENDEKFYLNPQASEFIPSYFMAPSHMQPMEPPDPTPNHYQPHHPYQTYDEESEAFSVPHQVNPVFSSEELNGVGDESPHSYSTLPTLGPFIPIGELNKMNNSAEFNPRPIHGNHGQTMRLVQNPPEVDPNQQSCGSLFTPGPNSSFTKPVFVAPVGNVTYTPLYGLIGFVPNAPSSSSNETSSSTTNNSQGAQFYSTPKNLQRSQPLITPTSNHFPPNEQLQHIATLPLAAFQNQQCQNVFQPRAPVPHQAGLLQRPGPCVNIVIPGGNGNPMEEGSQNGYPSMIPIILPPQGNHRPNF